MRCTMEISTAVQVHQLLSEAAKPLRLVRLSPFRIILR